MASGGKGTRRQEDDPADAAAMVARNEAIHEEMASLRTRLGALADEGAILSGKLTRMLGILFGKRDRIAGDLRAVEAEIASRLARLRKATAKGEKRTKPPKSPKATPEPAVEEAAARTVGLPAAPVVPVETSIQPDGIVCLFDGVKRKMLMRHLKARYNVTPEEYRAHFGLPDDYPMTAPGYSASQSKAVKKAVVEGKLTPGGYDRSKSRKRQLAEAERGS